MDYHYNSDTPSLGSWREGIPPDPSPPPNILYDHPSRDQWDGPALASFSATSLELEQFPNFFSLAPYPPSYKFGPFNERDIPVKGSHDIADALLSLKNAVVHPELRGSLTPLPSRPSPPPPPLIPPPPPPPPLPTSHHLAAGPPHPATSSTSSSSSSSSSNMPHLGSTPYPSSVGQSSTTAGYCIPSPGPHSVYNHSHGHPTYPHNHPPHPQSLPTYSVNHDSLVMQSSYNGQPFPSHTQYSQYPDPCLSPTLQHGGQASTNVHFPSMSVNVSMSMNVGMAPNPNPNHYNCTGGNPSQAWMIQPPSPPPTLPPQPSLTVTHPGSAAPLLPQYGSSSSSSSSASSLPNQCNGYSSQFGPIVPEYRQLGAVDPRGVYYKSETPFKEKICQIGHRHHSHHAHHHHHHNHHPHAAIKRHHRYSTTPERATLSAVTTSGLENNFLKTNLCRICGKTYARPSTLKTHLRTHSGEKPYKCSTCSKSFSQAANLTAHLRTHSGEKPFRCPVCQRRFSQSSSVTTHMRTHSGERPYRCRMCKKAFSDSSTLTKHLRIHSGEKPYQCKLCLLRFSQSGNLNRHMRVHTTNM